MNDDNQNEQNGSFAPGQTFSPNTEPIQPPTPTTSQPPIEQPFTEQQIQAQQQTYPPVEQPVNQQQFNQAQQPYSNSARFPIKLVAIILGILIAIAALVTIVITIFNGSSLTTYDSQELDFTVGVPEAWNVSEINLATVDQVVARPAELTESSSNTTSLKVSHSSSGTYSSAEDFIAATQEREQNLNDSEYQSSFNISITNISREQLGTAENPEVMITYDVKDLGTDVEYKSKNYYKFENESSSVSITFVYSGDYSNYESSFNDIVESYATR